MILMPLKKKNFFWEGGLDEYQEEFQLENKLPKVLTEKSRYFFDFSNYEKLRTFCLIF